MPHVRILLVDDHQIVRQGVRLLIESSRPNWEICGEAASGQEGVDKIKVLHPDLVVLDLKMPDMNGFETTRLVRELGLRTRIVIFSMHNSAAFVAEANNAGADGYVRKAQASGELIAAIDTVLGGRTFFPVDSNLSQA
jgi:DNA-binding NarL/FixJ family response regulator